MFQCNFSANNQKFLKLVCRTPHCNCQNYTLVVTVTCSHWSTVNSPPAALWRATLTPAAPPRSCRPWPPPPPHSAAAAAPPAPPSRAAPAHALAAAAPVPAAVAIGGSEPWKSARKILFVYQIIILEINEGYSCIQKKSHNMLSLMRPRLSDKGKLKIQNRYIQCNPYGM